MQDEPTATDDAVVYFIQAERGGPVKIGFCGSRAGVPGRLAQLQTGNPEKLVVRGIVSETAECREYEWHRRFAQYRLVGEWFLNTDEVADATGAKRAAVTEDGFLLQPLLAKAFEAGRERGKLEGELETRCMLRQFFGYAMGWLFSDEATFAEDLELSAAEAALEAISNSNEAAKCRREAAKRLTRERSAS